MKDIYVIATTMTSSEGYTKIELEMNNSRFFLQIKETESLKIAEIIEKYIKILNEVKK